MKRLTYEFVKEQFEKEGYELLSKEYVNAKTKLEYRCPKGHRHNIKFSDWRQNRRCPICSREKGVAKRRVPLEFIKASFKEEGYILLSTEYKNCDYKLDYICPEGHKHSISWHNWKSGWRCPYCYDEFRRGQATKKTIEFIREQFKNENYKLLTEKYADAHQKLEYICPNGHKSDINWNVWQQGHRCFYCAIDRTADKNRLNIEFIRTEFVKENYQLLTNKYKNAHQKLEYVCPEGHKHKISWSDWKQGNRCPYCAIVASKGEIEVRNFIESLEIKVSPNDRSQIFNPETRNGLELDIFIPVLNKAIEYNGEYWHQNKNKDLLKQELCKLKNIELLTVWENDWKKEKNICENKIKEFIFN